MRSRATWVSLLLVGCLGLIFSARLYAVVTAENRKQIEEVRKELGKVKGLIAKKDLDEAARLVEDADHKLKQVAKDARIEENNKLISGLLKQVELHREAIAKRRGGGGAPAAGGGSVSFEKDVAPILVARCLRCHGDNNPRGNLRIDTFAGIVAGSGGAFVIPGKPQESLLVERIMATGDERMPKGGNPLTADEIKRITEWIKGGARFSGSNTTPLADLKAAPSVAKVDNTPIQINKATGDEKVSFSRDIAPWFVNLCLNCHG
ncbi:MAG: c-type cytochrome domain-containing protein, partial [Deltaproteobacteria bacterium]